MIMGGEGNEGKSLIVEGTFTDGQLQNGSVKVQYPNGDIYEGKMNHLFHREGMGKLYFRNGDKYDGEWSNNKRVGKGRLYMSDGSIFEGQFK